MRLDCGIQLARIKAWLDDELVLACADDVWTFVHDDSSCRITLTPLESRELGRVSIERTELTVEGSGKAQDEFMRLFTLRFISAGG